MDEAVRLDQARWTALCLRIAPALDAASAFGPLSEAYAEPHRAYHNAEHITECLARFDEVAAEAERPDEVEFALWLHDAVYKTRGVNSEALSAEWAVRLLADGGTELSSIQRVEAMILATHHSSEPSFADAALVVDIDLTILGRDPERFDRYEEGVRAEYCWVPGLLFRSRRKEMLEGFVERPHLYSTRSIRDRFESQARRNLARSIAAL